MAVQLQAAIVIGVSGFSLLCYRVALGIWTRERETNTWGGSLGEAQKYAAMAD
jgi:hypothetical protein